MGDYRDLEAWQLAMNLVESVYKLTMNFSKEELFGPTGQMRRASVSVPSNIAEGASRAGSGVSILPVDRRRNWSPNCCLRRNGVICRKLVKEWNP